MNCQEGRIQIALHWPNATFAVMPTLRERFLDVGTTAMTVLRQFGGVGRNFMQDAASSCNRAFQPFDEHPWSMSPHALTILLLPRFVRQFFGDDGRARSDNLMDKPTMQTLAMGGQFTLMSSKTPSG
jgi:hypothetical protein